jgi:hypothetical protein
VGLDSDVGLQGNPALQTDTERRVFVVFSLLLGHMPGKVFEHR